jgi:hypothetical protein
MSVMDSEWHEWSISHTSSDGDRLVTRGYSAGMAVQGLQWGDHNHQHNHFYGHRTPSRDTLLGRARELAPDPLIGRDAELAELAAFCRGAEPYGWWQADPWAGKTALLATFVVGPPTGVDVLSFFVRAAEAYWSDSDGFESWMNLQLAAYLETTVSGVDDPRARQAEWRANLGRAADRAAERGRVLTLVIDGVDEDQSRQHAVALPSILSLLPTEPHPTLRIILSSRHEPSRPLDVMRSHPALGYRPRFLSSSATGSLMRDEAELELNTIRRTGRLAVDLLGFALASGGGISVEEVAGLVHVTVDEARETLDTVTRRTLRESRHPDGGIGFAFAHDTLREQAEIALGSATIDRYRTRVERWAEMYRRKAWPDDTPAFLLTRYGRLLSDTGRHDELTGLAVDPDRHALMRRRTGGDGAALAEIVLAQDLWGQSDEPDLTAAVGLARVRWQLTRPNLHLAESLPAVWALLGRPDRALSAVNAMDDGQFRQDALATLADALGGTGEFAHAMIVAAAVDDPEAVLPAWMSIARSMVRQGHAEDADRLIVELLAHADEDAAVQILMEHAEVRGVGYAAGIRQPQVREGALGFLAQQAFDAGDLDEVRMARDALHDDLRRAYATTFLILAGRERFTGDVERRLLVLADTAVEGIRDWALAFLAGQRIRDGRAGEADGFLAAMDDTMLGARHVIEAWVERGELTRIPSVAAGLQGRAPDVILLGCARLVEAGRYDLAQSLADQARDPVVRVRGLAEVAMSLLDAGDDAGAALLARAERMAGPAGAVVPLLVMTASLGDRVLTARLLRAVDPDEVLTVAHALARAGAQIATRQALDLLPDPTDHAPVIIELAQSTLGADRVEVAREAALLIEEVPLAGARLDFDDPDFEPGCLDPDELDEAGRLLGQAALILAQAGAGEDADRLAVRAEAAARSIVDPVQEDDELLFVAVGLARLGEPDRAEELVRRIRDGEQRQESLTELAEIATERGDYDRAIRYDTDPKHLQLVVESAIESGDLRSAMRAAGAITTPNERAMSLAAVAEAVRAGGDADFAHSLTADALGRLDPEAGLGYAESAAALLAVGIRAGRPTPLQSVERAMDPIERALLYAALAERADAGHARVALRLVEGIAVPRDRALILVRLAEAAAAHGETDQVYRMVAQAAACAQDEEDSWWFPMVLERGLRALLKAGAPDRAENLFRADRTLSGRPDPQMQMLLAASLAAAGHLDRAERVAYGIEDRFGARSPLIRLAPTHLDHRDQALLAVVAAHAEAGSRPETSLAVAERINGPVERAAAFTAVACGLAKDRRPVRARRVLARAFAQGEWAAPLHGLVEVAPDVAREVLTDLVRNGRGG